MVEERKEELEKIKMSVNNKDFVSNIVSVLENLIDSGEKMSIIKGTIGVLSSGYLNKAPMMTDSMRNILFLLEIIDEDNRIHMIPYDPFVDVITLGETHVPERLDIKNIAEAIERASELSSNISDSGVIAENIDSSTECPECGHPFFAHEITAAEVVVDDNVIKSTSINCTHEGCEKAKGMYGCCYGAMVEELSVSTPVKSDKNGTIDQLK